MRRNADAGIRARVAGRLLSELLSKQAPVDKRRCCPSLSRRASPVAHSLVGSRQGTPGSPPRPTTPSRRRRGARRAPRDPHPIRRFASSMSQAKIERPRIRTSDCSPSGPFAIRTPSRRRSRAVREMLRLQRVELSVGHLRCVGRATEKDERVDIERIWDVRVAHHGRHDRPDCLCAVRRHLPTALREGMRSASCQISRVAVRMPPLMTPTSRNADRCTCNGPCAEQGRWCP